MAIITIDRRISHRNTFQRIYWIRRRIKFPFAYIWPNAISRQKTDIPKFIHSIKLHCKIRAWRPLGNDMHINRVFEIRRVRTLKPPIKQQIPKKNNNGSFCIFTFKPHLVFLLHIWTCWYSMFSHFSRKDRRSSGYNSTLLIIPN